MKFVLTDNESNVYTCSECGEEWILLEGSPKDNNMNFCMKCGMRVNETDDQRFIESVNSELYRLIRLHISSPCDYCVHRDIDATDYPCFDCQLGSNFYYNEDEIQL